ncbi:MAG: hypothetical protein IPF72_13180 [Chitinophagaceae bacterium]|nr:hypothetical protein [Chitinophagaceae bacterium]
MKILIGILIINGFLTVPAFSQKIKFNTNDSLAVFDSNDIIRKRDDSVNYKGYIRVFDGLVVEQIKAVPQEIKVTSILRLNDTIKLRKLGVKH